tara:strand:- start:196 stop:1302 length:1107 start_codon:yes stop_codon:yes gene_type:complete
MKNNHDNHHANINENLIDIVAVLKKLWIERKLIVKSTISFFIIGCLIALISPVIYTSQTTFVPQISDDQMSPSSKLGSLATLAGLDINSNDSPSDSYLSPLLYTKIIDSEEFSLKLLSSELISSNSDKLTIREYLLSNKSSFSFNPFSFIKKYTIGLFLNEETVEIDDNILKNYNFISELDYTLLKRLRKKFMIELNEKEGFVKVLATDKSALISTQLVEQVTKSLQSKIIDIRTNKIKERLEFSKKQYDLKQAEFNLLVNKLAEFKDSNKNISTALFLSELQKLESEYQLQQNILINLASVYNNNKIKLNKDTPIFSVIDEVSVPKQRTKPKRTIIVIIYVFLGLILSVGFILFKDSLFNLIKEFKD